MTAKFKPPAGLWPSYHRPLETAREGVRAGGNRLSEAIDQLRALREQYGHVQAIGHELVLALLQAGRQHEAMDQLDALDQQFSLELDEETLSRRGRCYKEAADAALAANDLIQAEQWYRRALDRYEAAFALRHGHYPGINLATTLLLLAVVVSARGRLEESATLQRRIEKEALQLLADRPRWPVTYSDDNIWHLATTAEAYLLLRQWGPAAEAYRQAFAERNVQPFHRESAGKQARRILAAWRRLGEEPPAPGFPLKELFDSPPVAPQ